MSGLELQRQLIVDHPDLPIVFITAQEDENCRRQALQAGAVAFLYKPFSEQDLLNAIDAAVKDPGDKQ
jgi:FixJ family two-component response regulator